MFPCQDSLSSLLGLSEEHFSILSRAVEVHTLSTLKNPRYLSQKKGVQTPHGKMTTEDYVRKRKKDANPSWFIPEGCMAKRVAFIQIVEMSYQ